MKNCLRYMFCPLMLLIALNTLRSGENYFEFEYLKYPEVITVPENWSREDLYTTLKCYVKYTGLTTICKDGGGSLIHYICGDIVYEDSNEKMLQNVNRYIDKISPPFNECDKMIEMELGGVDGPIHGFTIAFEEGAIYSYDIRLIDRFLFERADISRAISMEKLSSIKVKVDTIFLEWSSDRVIQGWKEKKFKITINKDIEVRILYERKKDALPGGIE